MSLVYSHIGITHPLTPAPTHGEREKEKEKERERERERERFRNTHKTQTRTRRDTDILRSGEPERIKKRWYFLRNSENFVDALFDHFWRLLMGLYGLCSRFCAPEQTRCLRAFFVGRRLVRHTFDTVARAF